MIKSPNSHARTRAVRAGPDMATAKVNAPAPVAKSAIWANPASATAATRMARLQR